MIGEFFEERDSNLFLSDHDHLSLESENFF